MARWIELKSWQNTVEGKELDLNWDKLKPFLKAEGIAYEEEGNRVFLDGNQMEGVADLYRSRRSDKRKKKQFEDQFSGARRASVYQGLMKAIREQPMAIQRALVENINESLPPGKKLLYREIEFFSNIHPKDEEYRDSLYTKKNQTPTDATKHPEGRGASYAKPTDPSPGASSDETPSVEDQADVQNAAEAATKAALEEKLQDE
ncbi:MAG: hypothetical protein Q9167_007963 [Letrouitia subvulpina]